MTRVLKVSFLSVDFVHVEILKDQFSECRFSSFWDELRARFDAFKGDPKLKVILISGELSDETDDEIAERPSTKSAFEGAVKAVENCTKGFVLASACDIRVAVAGILIDVKDIAGLGSVGNTALKRLYWTTGGSSWTNSVILGAQPFKVAEAFQNRIISKVWDDKDEAVFGAMALARLVSRRSAESIQHAKRVWVAIRNASDAKIPTNGSWYSEEQAERDLDRALGVGLVGVRALL